MKRCPTCDSTYTDETLSFCPNDGTPLQQSAEPSTPSYDPMATIMAPPPSSTQNPSTGFGEQPGGWGTPSDQSSGWGTPPAQQYGSGPVSPPAQNWSGGTGGFQPPPPPGYPATGQKQQGLAIASLVCGILSIVCCMGLFTGVPALIMGFMSMNKEKADPAHYGGKGLAIGGMITGAVGTIFGTLWLILQLIALASR
jgi:hypothetical protein